MLELQKYYTFNEKKEIFNHRIINDFQELLSIIDEYNNNEYFIFRGVNNASYKIYSSMHRYFIERGVDIYNGKITEVLSNIVQKICKEYYLISPVIQHISPYFDLEYFKKERKRIYSKMLTSYVISFYILSLLQHYGGISSLLDFTNNINNAIFFSTRNWNTKKSTGYETENYISLYIFNTRNPFVKKFNMFKYNDKDTNFSKENIIEYVKNIDSSEAKEISYRVINYILFEHVDGTEYYSLDDFLINPNMVAQEGCFVSYKHYKNKPLEDNCESGSIICVDISKSLIPLIQKDILIPKEVNEGRLFPNIKKQIEQIMIDTERLFLDKSD